MDDGDGEGDKRTFSVDFSGEGLVKLQETVKDKLKEFLGDYTDDTLAEYVIVLLRNGRQKDEVRKELSVFLENDSVAFVSWLWDHLSSNLHLYQTLEENFSDGEDAILEKYNQEMDNLSSGFKSDSEDNVLNEPVIDTSSRRKREWRGLGRDEALTSIQSTLVENIHAEETLRKRSPVRRSRSPRQGKRRRSEVNQTLKEKITKPVLRAPSRLLQFAVRDAVKAASQLTQRAQPVSLPEPSRKRLRSVISSSTINSSPDEASSNRTIQPISDLSIPKSSRSVFSRLGVIKNSDHQSTLKDRDLERKEQEHEMSKSACDDEKHVHINGSHQNIFLDKEEIKRETQREDQELPSAVSENTVKKVLSKIKLPEKEPIIIREISEEKMETSQENPVNSLVESFVQEPTSLDAHKDTQVSTPPATGSSYSTARPSEDADSRTIFVSNVHFAATKDSLTRHFNKFGEVLKVIIVTDASTGMPTGSAYVEFLRNESAELSLSFNGTSFMSRILKIVLKSSSAHQEPVSTSPWSRGTMRGAQSYMSRGGRYPFSRAPIASAQRGRLSIKPGARSLQWKRETASPMSPADVASGVRSLLSPTGRNLTYVRSKPDPASA